MFTYIHSIRHIEKKIFIFLCAVLLGISASYGFFVQATVLSIVERKTIERDIESLTSTLSEFEASYIARAGIIDRKYAEHLGFSESQKEVFAPRKRLVQNIPQGF
ncbi:MAG: hypothetical protein AAB727_03450 [Patescibacteria group bacterium]